MEVVEETSFHDVLVSEVGAALQDEGGVDVQHICCHVAQGQIAQNTKIPTTDDNIFIFILSIFLFFLFVLPFLKVVGLYGNFSSPQNAVVGEHHALGVASGAAGVDQGRALVDGDAPQPGLEGSVLQAVTSAEHVLPADDPGRVWNAGVLDNFLQVGKVTLEAPDLVQLPLVLHHEDVALAVLQDVLAGLGPVGGVNARGKSSRKNSRQVGNNPLGRVETENAD